MTTRTHTYAVLEVSPEAYREIRSKMKQGGRADAVLDQRSGEVIIMQGVALRCSEQPTAMAHGQDAQDTSS